MNFARIGSNNKFRRFPTQCRFQILPEHESRVWLVATSLKKYEKDDDEKLALGARSLSVALNWLEIINFQEKSETSFAKKKFQPILEGQIEDCSAIWTEIKFDVQV